jgi:hypothetical protein
MREREVFVTFTVVDRIRGFQLMCLKSTSIRLIWNILGP